MSDLENKKSPVVITIARDFGAEGHEIGRMLADELGIPLYDNELLVRASLRAGESLDKDGCLRRAPGRGEHGISARPLRCAFVLRTSCSKDEPGDFRIWARLRAALSKAVCPITCCCATIPITLRAGDRAL